VTRETLKESQTTGKHKALSIFAKHSVSIFLLIFSKRNNKIIYCI
jgi:hypothetical protein